jgi:deoxyribodipyrimidine photo-lyase
MVKLFIFRRDLRIEDNYALDEALETDDKILFVFIFTPEQVQVKSNPYFSNNAFQFMIESLEELKKKLNNNLFFFKGDNIDVIKSIYEEIKFDGVYFNKDYTPYAIERDLKIKTWCDNKKITCNTFEDYSLHPLETIKKDDRTPYQVFTPFYKKAIQLNVNKPNKAKLSNNSVYNQKITTNYLISDDKIEKLYSKNPDIYHKGGRTKALKILNDIKTKNTQKQYDDNRNIPNEHTTMLSPYIKFGCVSIREVYHCILKKYNKHHTIIKELYWREFYAYITYFNPRVLKGKNFKEDIEIDWKPLDNTKFKKWCNGETGYPIVDAGMRQLNTIGWMHNRVRMITASFLVKHLHIHWRSGEKYFATKLTDYDPCSNNGGWQWCASTGADAQPYFRIFNPWTQTKTHDKNCEYIKNWIPELVNVESKKILEWDELSKTESFYIKPIVDHKKATTYTKEILFK